MRRILLLLSVAAMVLALTAGPALAQADPTNPPSTDEKERLNESNCVGAGSADFAAGKGGLPGSQHDQVKNTFGLPGTETTFNGPVTSYYAKELDGLGEVFPSSGNLDCGGPAGKDKGPA